MHTICFHRNLEDIHREAISSDSTLALGRLTHIFGKFPVIVKGIAHFCRNSDGHDFGAHIIRERSTTDLDPTCPSV